MAGTCSVAAAEVGVARKRARRESTSATKPINVVVDLSHHNEKVDFVKMKADGIVGVIRKATQGLT
jgi:GH25 family lysozyme M1 (1,4-beta-N-acetylmuramidase)